MLVLYVVPNHMDIQVQSLGRSGFRLLKIPSAITDAQYPKLLFSLLPMRQNPKYWKVSTCLRIICCRCHPILVTSVHFATILIVLQWQVINEEMNIFHNEFRGSQENGYFIVLMANFIVIYVNKLCFETFQAVWWSLISGRSLCMVSINSWWSLYVCMCVYEFYLVLFWAAANRSKRFYLYLPLLPKTYFFKILRKSADKVSKPLALWNDCSLLFVVMKNLNWNFLRWKYLYNHDTTVAWRVNLWSQIACPHSLWMV